MAENAEPMVKCENCEADVPESKSFLHESYCRRNVVRCKKCNKPVDKSELETHEKEAHLLAPCKFCKKEFEPTALANHVNYCDRKPQMCHFCNCEVNADEIKNHLYQCGSRTKKCSICSKNIMIRDFDFHEQSCELNQKNYANNFPEVKEEKKVDKPVQVQQPKPKPTSYGIEEKSTVSKTTTTSTSTSSTQADPKINPYNKPTVATTSTSTSTTSKLTSNTSLPSKQPYSYGLESQDKKVSSVSTQKNDKPSGQTSIKPTTNVTTTVTNTTKVNTNIYSGNSQKPKKTQEELDAELAKHLMEAADDDDEALAKKLQEDFDKKISVTGTKINQSSQPKRNPNMGSYDLNDNQYDDDLDEDYRRMVNETAQQPVKKSNAPSYDPFAQADSDFQNDLSGEDAEIQKAIEESLKGAGGGVNFGSTMDSEEFKRVLELSKKYK